MSRTKPVSLFLLLLIAALVLPNPIVPIRQASADEVWIPVSTASELSDIRNNLSGNYRLTQDIDLGSYDFGDGHGWKPIGDFAGKLDGNGFVIRNMKIDRPNDNNVGLFGTTTTGATITNVHLTNIDVVGNSTVGGLAGWSTISIVSSSSVEGSIRGKKQAALLIGYNSLTDISDSYTYGQVKIDSAANSEDFGGLVAYNTDNGTKGKIVRSYSAAEVQSGTNSGGLIGRRDGYLLAASSYWDTDVSEHAVSAGGTGKPTDQMKLKTTFAGWDFTGDGSTDPVWGMVEKATYPLHYSDYRKVALASLTVKDEGDIVQELDREFASDYGEYAVRVANKTDQIVVSGSPLSPSSAVSVEGGGASATLTLDPGVNELEIEVSDPANPTWLTAVYKLTVYRDAGTAQYPHRITTADQLSKIGDSSEGYGMNHAYRLDADIDLSGFAAGSGWTPIGNAAEPFQGVFEGNGHTIARLKIDRPGADNVGLFGVTSGADVSNIALLDVDIQGKAHVGGLIGHAEDTTVSGIAVQGAVTGDSDAAGLIGTVDALTTVSESYAAAAVTATSGDAGGLIASGAAGGAVTHSFWDSERGGSASSGGGTSKTTPEMMRQATYADYPGSIWQFGSGNRWGMIDGTTYPMPYASYAGVIPLGIAVTAPGTTVTLAPSSFNPARGAYTAALAAPVPEANVTVNAAAGQTVTINDIPGTSAIIDLGLGEHSVDIRVKGANGASGSYRFTLTVPAPTVQAVQVPPAGNYGIGDELEFVVSYDHPVDVDTSQAPAWPIGLDGSSDATAAYIGKLGGDAKRLLFRYTVQEGDSSTAGIVPGVALSAPASSSITANGQPVSKDLSSPLPDTSNVVIDGIKPDLALTPSTTGPTNGSVTVSVYADGTLTGIGSLLWAEGIRDASYFGSGGTAVVASAFEAESNGNYTVYAVDEAGNEKIETIAISNILTDKPTILLDYNPKTPVRIGVDVSVTASVTDNGSGNGLAELRWAEGERTAADFASEAFGTDVASGGTFHVTDNGTYTVYAADTAGNERVQPITVGNIVTTKPSIVLDYDPKTPLQTGVDVSVTASVYDNGSGNVLEALRWAEGERTAADFSSETFGTDVASGGTFHVTNNGTYTVYAADTAGNEQIETIAITNVRPAGGSTSSGTNTSESVTDRIQYHLQPGRDYTLEFDGLRLFVPARAIDREMTITIRKLGDEQRATLGSDRQLLGDVYELTKDVPGTFNAPVRISFTIQEGEGNDDLQPILAYYDETAGDWVELGGTVAGGVLTGETDHFTKFAAVAAVKEPEPVLNDIDGHWAEQAIREGVAKGLIDGYPNGTFRPDAPVTRAEFTAMLYRAIRWPSGQSLGFEDDRDIPEWAKEAVAAAVQARVINGYADRTFRPAAAINRAEAAVMIAKTAELPMLARRTAFADDAAIGEWAAPYIEAARSAGLVQGQAFNRFEPSASTTRAEAVVLLLRLHTLKQ